MMATESPVRMVESGGGRKWATFKDSAVFESPIKSMAEEEFELLLNGCRIHGDQMDMIPSRSGSAPPSMEGSFAAISNILAQQSFTTSSSLESLREVIENFESEEQLRSDPAYFAYYCSNVNLNPRLPPPLMSRENRRLVRHMGGFGNTWRPSLNDDGNKSFQLSKGSLPTHKEEPEDDGSPKETVKISSSLTSGRNTSLAGRHKSLVDLIQEDFPRTPSPVYSQSRSSSFVAEEAITRDVQAISTNISSLKISKVAELDPVFSDVSIETHAPEAQAGGIPSPQRDGSNNDDVNLEGSTSLGGSLHSDVVRMESQHHLSAQQSIPHQAPGVQVQSISQGMKQTHNVVDNRSHTYAKPSPIDLQPSSHPPALNPHLCASTAAYMNSGSPLYPNFQPSGLYSPQYSVGGYPFGSGFIHPFVAGYPSHSSINAPFGASSSSSGENIVNSGGFQHLGKIYGQQGLMLPPSFADRHHMQYFQHPFVDAFGATAPNLFALNAATSGMIDPFVATKSPSANANYQKALLTTNGNIGIPGTGGVGFAGNSYYISSTGMGVMPQFPASPLASPVLPSSPVGGINLLGRQNSMIFSQGSSRNAVPFSGGQGQRGLRSFDDPKRHNFLEELKSSSGRKVELSDIAGHIVEFSVDQHGSRFIQQKLEHCSVEEKESVFNEILPHSSKLMTDVFGNYVIQKFFEHGGPEQRKELADKLAGQMLHLSLQMYGCRVIQKALEVIEPEQKAQLVQELDGHVIRCVHDQNGNHVIQKCIECVPADNGYFIISAFHGQVATLSTHPYGCRVIQRVLEHCLNEEQSQFIVDEILESADILALDQYGNYVTQHVLERGKPQERSRIISKLKGKFVQMSQHKYASNVVEKCLKYGDMVDREHLIQEIIGQSEGNDNLLTMMKDQFANYVVQKILDTSNDDQKKILLNIIRSHLQALKKYTYGKHIVARFEQLCAEETQNS